MTLDGLEVNGVAAQTISLLIVSQVVKISIRSDNKHRSYYIDHD